MDEEAGLLQEGNANERRKHGDARNENRGDASGSSETASVPAIVESQPMNQHSLLHQGLSHFHH